MELVDWIGFVGVFQILMAYVLNISGKLKQDKLSYILLNLIGAGMACLASVLMNYWPFILLEGVWTIASLITLIRYRKTSTLEKA